MKRLLAKIGAVLAGFTWFGVRRFFSHQERFPVRDTHGVVTVFGSRIRYRRTEGIGPPIVLVHGYNLSIEDWEPVAELLDGREVIALDLVGFGGSDRPADLSYDLDCQRRFLVGFMDELRLERAVLVGHSIGGAIVTQTASRSPDRVTAAVLLAPAGIPGCLSNRWPKSLLCRPGVLNRLAFRISCKAWFRRVFPRYVVRQYLGITGSFDDSHAQALDDIRCPVLVIWSERDEHCRPEYAEVYRERLADVEVRMLPPEVGHRVPVAAPSDTAALIGEFVDGLAVAQN